jgi:hypothetical protein
MADLGAIGADNTVGTTGISGAPSGGVSAIGLALRVVLSLGTALGIYAPIGTGTHQREVILEGLRLILSLGGTAMDTRVYRGRKLPVEDIELPAALVYQADEQSQPDDVNYRKGRVLQVVVELHQKSQPSDLNAPDIETALNVLAREVEVLVEADPSLAGRCLWAEHSGTEVEIESGETDRGLIRLKFDVHYRTVRTEPATQA